jgi:hypothetical protein
MPKAKDIVSSLNPSGPEIPHPLPSKRVYAQEHPLNVIPPFSPSPWSPHIDDRRGPVTKLLDDEYERYLTEPWGRVQRGFEAVNDRQADIGPPQWQGAMSQNQVLQMYKALMDMGQKDGQGAVGGGLTRGP